MQIEVYQDIACPWCRIGKRHLANALEAWQGEPVEVTYRTFFLNSDIPSEGYDFREYMRAKGGGDPDLERWFDAPRQMGAAVGVTFHFDRITKAPNTLLAHRAIRLTPQAQRAAMIDALYDAYFEFGEDVGSIDVIAQAAERAGVDATVLRAQLATDAESAEVEAEALEGAMRGVTGVPLFVFNGRYGVSGAQPPEVLLQVMARVTAA
jgi:predicted DsbA family dithiol-disulfide isomerase